MPHSKPLGERNQVQNVLPDHDKVQYVCMQYIFWDDAITLLACVVDVRLLLHSCKYDKSSCYMLYNLEHDTSFSFVEISDEW